jgi:hypothetical protein
MLSLDALESREEDIGPQGALVPLRAAEKAPGGDESAPARRFPGTVGGSTIAEIHLNGFWQLCAQKDAASRSAAYVRSRLAS